MQTRSFTLYCLLQTIHSNAAHKHLQTIIDGDGVMTKSIHFVVTYLRVDEHGSYNVYNGPTIILVQLPHSHTHTHPLMDWVCDVLHTKTPLVGLLATEKLAFRSVSLSLFVQFWNIVESVFFPNLNQNYWWWWWGRVATMCCCSVATYVRTLPNTTKNLYFLTYIMTWQSGE